MATSSLSISYEIDRELREFCNLYQYIYEHWIIYAFLFEDMSDRIENKTDLSLKDFLDTSYGSCFNCLKRVIHNYCILEIAKLHDPADQLGHRNLSIDYVLEQDFRSEAE